MGWDGLSIESRNPNLEIRQLDLIGIRKIDDLIDQHTTPYKTTKYLKNHETKKKEPRKKRKTPL